MPPNATEYHNRRPGATGHGPKSRTRNSLYEKKQNKVQGWPDVVVVVVVDTVVVGFKVFISLFVLNYILVTG